MAKRWAWLLAACLPVLAVLGALAPGWQPSALRVLVASVVALLAPLFWPGLGDASPWREALRLGAWCLAALALAGLGLAALGRGQQRWAELAAVCAMLLPILLLSHLLAAAIQAGLGDRAGGAAAGGAVAVLALLGAAPLWLGPVAELLSASHPGALDAVLAASPVVHLAVASGLDILRSAWFYRHSNLASLPVNYPDLAMLAAVHALACAAGLAWLAAALRRRARHTLIC